MKIGVLFVAGLFLYSCTPYHIGATQPRGIYHRIKSGDTLWSIARAYGVNIQDLAEVNNVDDPNLIGVDNIIFVPDVNYIVEDVMTSVDIARRNEDSAQKDNSISPVMTPKIEPRSEKTSPKLQTAHVKDAPKDQQKLSVKTAAQKDNGISPVMTPKIEPRSEKTSPKLPTPHVKDAPKDQQKLSVKTTASGNDGDFSTPTKSVSQNTSGTSDGKKVSEVEGKMSTMQDIQHKDSDGNSDMIKFDRNRFIWPVKGKVRSKFGIQPNGMYSNGIRISAKEGNPVLAAASGTVIKSTLLKCCGETIIIKHEDNYATVYTDLGNRMVKEDDQVKKGGRIALPAKSDKRGEAYVHFEIRHKNKARNPLFFLP